MKKLNKKSLALLIAAALLLTFTVSSTVAYLVDSTNALVNTFNPTHVTVDVKDTIATVNGAQTKQNVVITNTSNIAAYIRAAVVGYWVKDGNIVAPWNGSITPNAPWTFTDGFYYYPNPVDAGAAVPTNLFTSYQQPTPPVEGAHLEMEILAQAIQADGMGATSAQDAFSKAAQSN